MVVLNKTVTKKLKTAQQIEALPLHVFKVTLF